MCQAGHQELSMCYHTNCFNSFKLFAFASLKHKDQETSLERENATAYGCWGMVIADGTRGWIAAGFETDNKETGKLSSR